jgi:hypothetical protein
VAKDFLEELVQYLPPDSAWLFVVFNTAKEFTKVMEFSLFDNHSHLFNYFLGASVIVPLDLYI